MSDPGHSPGYRCTAWQGGCKDAYDAGYRDAQREAEHQMCESCRFWDRQKNDNPDYMHRCTVSGSFRCEGGTLYTEPSFRCGHHSRRDT